MADKELWYAGDKVRLIGTEWNDSYGVHEGGVVTLVKAVDDNKWEIAEGDPAKNGGYPLWVRQDPTRLFAAELAEACSPFRPITADRIKILDPNVSGEVRTTSSTGGQKGVKPEAYALIPWEAMDEVARVYNEGAKKYAAHNWRNGYEWSKSFSAACRHLFAFWRGEDRDPELGTLHLANAAFHILGMITFALDREKYGEHDDRYTSTAPNTDG